MPSAPRVGSARGTRHPVRFPWAVGAASGASRRVRTAGCRQRRGRSLPAARARPGAFLQRAAGSGPSARPCAPRAGWCRHRVSIRAAAGCGCLCICVSVCHEGCVVGSSSSPRCSWSLGTVQSPLAALPPGRWPWLVWVSLCSEEGKSTRWRRQPSWCGAFPQSPGGGCQSTWEDSRRSQAGPGRGGPRPGLTVSLPL